MRTAGRVHAQHGDQDASECSADLCMQGRPIGKSAQESCCACKRLTLSSSHILPHVQWDQAPLKIGATDNAIAETNTLLTI